MTNHNGPIRGLGFADFAHYDDNNGHRSHYISPGAEQCLECPHPDCIIGYNPSPEARRCPLEEYLHRRGRNGNGMYRRGPAHIPQGYVTVAEAARRAGISRKGFWGRLKRGIVPGAIRDGKFWLVPVEAIE